jgi:dTDP-4-dehydrorhamnose reductase
VRVILVGAAGQLGRELVRVLPATTVPLTRAELDLRDVGSVAARVAALAPEVVVNAAADNRVDAAEDDPSSAVAVNDVGVEALARACRDLGAFLVHFSTDYVFDGRATRPYTEDDVPDPNSDLLSNYARSKLAGELHARTLAPRHAVVRVAGLYAAGGSTSKGGSFVDRVVARARAGERLRVVDDQMTAPTWARDVAALMKRFIPRLASGEAPGGVYHVTNAGQCSWYEFACAALELAGVDTPVEPVKTKEYPARAPRPAYSVLASTRLAAAGEPPLRPWREALGAYLADRG